MIKLRLLNIRSLTLKALIVNDMITEYNLDMLRMTETWLKTVFFSVLITSHVCKIKGEVLL